MFEGFTAKYVQGLYSFTHYERANGDWIQVRHGTVGARIAGAVFRKSDGGMWFYETRAELTNLMLEHLGA